MALFEKLQLCNASEVGLFKGSKLARKLGKNFFILKGLDE
jgi:hypothetical protein